MLRDVLLVGFVSAACWPASACQCEASFGACKEARVSDLVFIGEVQSIQPLFLDRWYGTNQSAMQSLNDAFLRAQEHPSPDSLRGVKQAYLATFPQLDERQKKLVETADSLHQMTSLFDSSLERGMRVHFSVKSIYKREDDGDDAKAAPKKAGPKPRKDDDDDKKAPDFLDVWTAADDCGYNFQLGETYLVYANNEEGADYYFTGTCMRTKRLSDAGEDLGYLYFYKNQPEASSRIEGFATSDRKSQLALDAMHDPAAIGSPISAAVVQLQSDRSTRYSETDGSGRFVFDGLPDGSYQLSAFAAGYPKINQLLSGPRRVTVKERSCVRQVFVLPKPGG
jgi:Carboxypeptidase regulatory-like domain